MSESGIEQSEEIIGTPFDPPQPTTLKQAQKLGFLPVLLILALLVAASIAWFLFTAKAVEFSIAPVPDKLEITDGFHYQIGKRYLMLPGKFTLQAQLKGYQSLQETIVVTTHNDQLLRFNLVKKPGRLNISTRPDVETRVFIDQVFSGTTPLREEQLEAGLHDISLVSERYLRYETGIDITGMELLQEIQATLEPAWITLRVSSDPAGATIKIDDQMAGITPAQIEILEGKRELSVEKPGYKKWQRRLQVQHDVPQTLDEILLTEADGKITINTIPADASIRIDKNYQGQSPVSVELSPGNNYTVVANKAGYKAVQKQVWVEPEQDIELSLTLVPITGKIKIVALPVDSELWIDGALMGSANQEVRLSATRHELEVRKPGFATYRKSITPQPKLNQQLMITLKTQAEAKIDAIPQVVSSSVGDQLNLVLPGDLTLGAQRRDRGRRSNEILRQVTLTRAYYLGSKEVTNRQYKQFSPGHDPGFFGRSLLGEDDRPVVNIAWADAIRYCNWLSQKDGLPVAYIMESEAWRLISPGTTGYRLPTEAEWAYASRFAQDRTPSRFPWGDSLPPPENFGNFADESATGMVPYIIKGYNDSFRGPAPSGTFPANDLGLYDLAGNVSEWVNDRYSVELSKDLELDRRGPESGEYFVIRGSNFSQGRFSELRWTYRDYGADARQDVGFRIARDVAE